MRIWEQLEVIGDIPIINVEMTIPDKHTEAVISLRGDQHIGMESCVLPHVIAENKRIQEMYKDRLFVIDSGDMIDNGLKTSIGHNYDLSEPDPDKQLGLAIKMQEELDEHLYGKQTYYTMKAIHGNTTKHARRIGFLGNHEYRSRRASGTWLNRQEFGGRGVIDGWIHALIKLKIKNKKLKLSKTYTIYSCHRLTGGAESISIASLLKNFENKSKIIKADIFTCGHYHKSVALPGTRYDDNGKIKKVLYTVNPSPAFATEYGTWAMYNPLMSGFSRELFLPLDKFDHAYSMV